MRVKARSQKQIIDRNKAAGSRSSFFCLVFWRHSGVTSHTVSRWIVVRVSPIGVSIIVYGWRDAHCSMKIVLTLSKYTCDSPKKKSPIFWLILTYACSTPCTLQAGTVQRSDQHIQQGVSYTRKMSRNTDRLVQDVDTDHTCTDKARTIFMKHQHARRRSEISSDIDRPNQ